MLRTIGRLTLRLAGWLLTPIAATVAAALGAVVGAIVAARFSTPQTGLLITIGAALIGGTVGLWLWLRLVRATPELQEVLAVTPDGVPTEEALDEFVPPEQPEEKRTP